MALDLVMVVGNLALSALRHNTSREDEEGTSMTDQSRRDQDAHRDSQENEKRHREAIQEVARRNEAAHKEAKKVRQESDRIKMEMRRHADSR